MAPLTHPGYHITAMVAGQPLRFLIDSGLSFSCIRQEDLRHIQLNMPQDAIRPAWGGCVTVRLPFRHLGTRETTLQILPRDSELESSLGWDTLGAWEARIEFSHDTPSPPCLRGSPPPPNTPPYQSL